MPSDICNFFGGHIEIQKGAKSVFVQRKVRVLVVDFLVKFAVHIAVNMGELTLPEGLTKIVSSAFYDAGITKLTGPSTLTMLGYDCFRGDGFAGSTLVTVDFSNCTNLNTLTGSAFYDCHYLKNVTLPEGLKVIGDAAFQNCYSIEEITIPNSVQTIEVNTFWMFSELYQHELKKVILGSGLQQIQANAFGECGNIVEIYSLNPVHPHWQTMVLRAN